MKPFIFVLATLVGLSITGVITEVRAEQFDPPPVSYQKTYVLAISACPPWQPEVEAKACEDIVNRFTEVMRDTMKVPKENIVSLHGENSSYAGFTKALADLKAKSAKDTRTILFMNVHGMPQHFDNDPSGMDDHELLVLWSEQKPFAVQTAIAQKQWMLSSELRDIVDTFRGDKVVIIDACHAGTSEGDLEHHIMADDLDGDEAIILSAGIDEYAHMTADRSMALFTARFTDVLEGGASSWGDAARVTRKLTEKESVEICKITPECSQIPKELWSQTPRIYDPEGILDGMKIVVD
jgi:hypothetical protein